MKPMVWILGMVLLAASPAASAAVPLEAWNGHVEIGYGKLFVKDAPSGSLSLGGGVDRALVPGFRLGLDLGYHLLGSRTVERGSLTANLDYSAFDVALQLHWSPPGLGPLQRISFGPGLFSAHAELSTAGGGAGFSDLAVSKIAPGLAASATLLRGSEAPIRLGLELGTRIGWLPVETWTLVTARLAVHY